MHYPPSTQPEKLRLLNRPIDAAFHTMAHVCARVIEFLYDRVQESERNF